MTSTTPPQDPFTAMRETLRPKVYSAQLRRSLLQQTTWWVPQTGWQKFQKVSLAITEVSAVNPAGNPTGKTIVTARMVANLDALDDTAGEKVAITKMSNNYRQHVINFLWNHSAHLLTALAWEHMISPEPFGGDNGGNLDATTRRHSAQMEATANDDEARLRWFNDQPLIVALRATSH